MEMSDREESNAKCHQCSVGLTYAEHTLYGNRCVFCSFTFTRIGFSRFVANAVMDWLIYNAIVDLVILKGPDGRMDLLGALGVLGYTDINQVKTVWGKIRLWWELRGMVK